MCCLWYINIGGREIPEDAWIFFILLPKQFYRRLGNRDLPHRVFRLGSADGDISMPVSHRLLVHQNGTSFLTQNRPKQVESSPLLKSMPFQNSECVPGLFVWAGMIYKNTGAWWLRAPVFFTSLVPWSFPSSPLPAPAFVEINILLGIIKLPLVRRLLYRLTSESHSFSMFFYSFL